MPKGKLSHFRNVILQFNIDINSNNIIIIINILYFVHCTIFIYTALHYAITRRLFNKIKNKNKSFCQNNHYHNNSNFVL